MLKLIFFGLVVWGIIRLLSKDSRAVKKRLLNNLRTKKLSRALWEQEQITYVVAQEYLAMLDGRPNNYAINAEKVFSLPTLMAKLVLCQNDLNVPLEIGTLQEHYALCFRHDFDPDVNGWTPPSQIYFRSKVACFSLHLKEELRLPHVDELNKSVVSKTIEYIETKRSLQNVVTG